MELTRAIALRDRAQPRRRALTVYAQHRERSRSMPARVVVPLVLAGGAQVVLVVACVAAGLQVGVIASLSVALAAVSVVLHRRTFGSLVAGAGMRVARPYVPGEQVRLFVPASDAVVTAEVVRVGPANTALMTRDGLVLVPNSRMLRDR